MKEIKFINDDFLLESDYAKVLFCDYASKLPIIDYHNHLPPEQIENDRIFENISQIWLNGDHYKWRAMRTAGVDETYITGNASDEDKFLAWANTVPKTLRNPLYHWTHIELKRYFDIDVLLNKDSAKEIYKTINTQLNTSDFSCRSLLRKMNVETLCTTEDPTDTLKHHKILANSNFKTKVSTAFRPDNAILIENKNYGFYLDKLSEVSKVNITSFDLLKKALSNRIDYFSSIGCKLSDHGLNFMPFSTYKESEVETIFQRRLNGEGLSELEISKFKTAILIYLCVEYKNYEWVQQFHLGALRNNNGRMLDYMGLDTGWDSIGDYKQAETLSNFLNALDKSDNLTKTIIYNLNPSDNEVFATMIGNFNDGSVKGKIQYGSSWWFLDQKDGITKQINALSNMGLLSCFVGMLTDSRSFLSFPRHEYFRRVLCNLLGKEMSQGELPKDMDLVGNMVADISYHNAKHYFQF